MNTFKRGTILFGSAISAFLLTLVSFSCVQAAEYSDRDISKAVEKLATRGDWANRKPILQKLESVLPRAIDRFKNSPGALRILEQIDSAVAEKLSICVSEETEKAFSSSNLDTDTSIRSIEMNEILSGGPPKDGIPALNNPKFVDVATAKNGGYLTNTSEGIVVENGGIVKFYPYQILNRHEIVNDTVGDNDVAITFCPLCGTAIVFDREFDGKSVEFGVSGKLYNSNLLMYDNHSESLWSQAIGKGVVGFYTDFQLEYVDSDVLEFSTFEALYPDGLVLGTDTGFNRDYGLDSPYGSYDDNEELYFPVKNIDSSYPKKTVLYVVNDTDLGYSVAFLQRELADAGSATLDVEGITYTARYKNGIVTVERQGTTLNTFTQMRFSWTAHDNYPRYVWDPNE